MVSAVVGISFLGATCVYVQPIPGELFYLYPDFSNSLSGAAVFQGAGLARSVEATLREIARFGIASQLRSIRRIRR
jgi:hypothetical protein